MDKASSAPQTKDSMARPCPHCGAPRRACWGGNVIIGYEPAWVSKDSHDALLAALRGIAEQAREAIAQAEGETA